jgi:hypothetical protein
MLRGRQPVGSNLMRVIVVSAIVLAFCGVCTDALAVEGHVPAEPPFGSFANGTGIGVDQANGNVYVVDSSANEVHVFGVEGQAPVGGGPSTVPGPPGGFNILEPSGPSAANGVVYVPDVRNNRVDKFALNASHEYEFLCEFAGFGGFTGSACLPNGGSPTNSFGEPLGTALDAAGDVYIADYGSGQVYEFNPAGEDIAAFSGGFSSGEFGRPEYVTVAANGTIYVLTFSGRVVKLTRSSLIGPVEGSPVELKIAFGATGFAYDGLTGGLFVDVGSAIKQLDSNGGLVRTFGAGVLSGAQGAAFNETTGDVYAVNGTAVQRFKRVVLPFAVTGAAKAVTHAAAELCGTVNPESTTLAASYQFEYGTTTGYGEVAPASFVSVGTGESPQEVCATVEGLKAGSLYHYRIVATNSEGENQGSDETLNTPPAVAGLTTLPATNVQPTSAVLQGSFEATGQDTQCLFQYGQSEEYGTITSPEDKGTQPNGTTIVEQEASGLQQGNVYHYRIVCGNSFGLTFGPDHTVTLPWKPPLLVGGPTAGQLTHASAQLSSTVNPQGSPTLYYYQYGETEAYGSVSTTNGLPPVETSTTAGPVTIYGLQPGTLYHCRLVAESRRRTVYGPDATFTTTSGSPPVVITGAASNVTQTTAAISASVNPEGLPTSYEVQTGTDTSYQGPAVTGYAGNNQTSEAVTATLTLLASGTTYHYRILATNQDGTSYGEDRTFTTLGLASPLLQPPASVLIAIPPFAFPPEPSPAITKPATHAQKLAKALKACKKQSKKHRAACERQARRRYSKFKKSRRK